MRVLGVDPGTQGYACLLDESPSFLEVEHLFWPAPHDEESGAYDLPAMVRLCREWGHLHAVALVVLEAQAPRPHGKGRAQKEGAFQAFKSGLGFGAWQAALVAAGFVRVDAAEAPLAFRAEVAAFAKGARVEPPRYYVVVEPASWKARMGATAVGAPGESDATRRSRANARTCEVAAKVAPRVDLRAVERTRGARTPSPDKAAALLLAHYGLRWIAGVEERGRG